MRRAESDLKSRVVECINGGINSTIRVSFRKLGWEDAEAYMVDARSVLKDRSLGNHVERAYTAIQNRVSAGSIGSGPLSRNNVNLVDERLEKWTHYSDKELDTLFKRRRARLELVTKVLGGFIFIILAIAFVALYVVYGSHERTVKIEPEFPDDDEIDPTTRQFLDNTRWWVKLPATSLWILAAEELAAVVISFVCFFWFDINAGLFLLYFWKAYTYDNVALWFEQEAADELSEGGLVFCWGCLVCRRSCCRATTPLRRTPLVTLINRVGQDIATKLNELIQNPPTEQAADTVAEQPDNLTLQVAEFTDDADADDNNVTAQSPLLHATAALPTYDATSLDDSSVENPLSNVL